MEVVVVSSRLAGEAATTSRHSVLDVVCVEDTDYGQAVASVWGGGVTVVNIEHDMQVTDDLIDALLDCPHPLCSWAYRVYPVSTMRPAPMWAHAVAQTQNGRLLSWPNFSVTARWISEGEQWADFSAIGFCKITPAAMADLIETGASWRWVEMAVNAAVTGPWHLHWPAVEHHHQ